MYNAELQNFTTPVKLQIVTYTTISGVNKKSYVDSDTFNVSWKSKGGTENRSNDVYMIEDTSEIVCWYNPKIQAKCRLVNLLNNVTYEILGEPENIDFRNQRMKFKVRAIKGGA